VTELRRVIELRAAPAVVWARLWDISALASCIPGCDGVEPVEERKRYRATIRDRVGPFRIAIPLDVTVEATTPNHLSVIATGRDATLGSPVKVGLTVTLEPRPDGGSCLRVNGQADSGGKLAALGQSVIQRKTRDVLDQFATNLEALFIGGRVGSGEAPASP
jgi:carbon monoxide dehydrogenase subunit G